MKKRDKKASLQKEMNLYDLAKLCAEPEGGYLDPHEMDKESYTKEQREQMKKYQKEQLEQMKRFQQQQKERFATPPQPQQQPQPRQ